MGFGDTAKRLQQVADTAEDLYTKVSELREKVMATQSSVERTEERVETIETELAEQRALLEAVAADAGVDLDEVPTTAHVDAAELDGAEEKADTGGEAADGDAEAEDVDEDEDPATDGGSEWSATVRSPEA